MMSSESNYAELRQPDPRIARIIENALGSAQTVLNVGAGTGSYEPTDRSVIAVEPSREMIRKRGPEAAKAIQASADDLPFDDKSFDACNGDPDHSSLARQGGRLARDAPRDTRPDRAPHLRSGAPAVADRLSSRAGGAGRGADAKNVRLRTMAGLRARSRRFRCRTIAATDSSMPTGAGPRPISMHKSGPAARPSGPSGTSKRDCEKLRRDLETGEWERRYAELLTLDEYDAGYRLVVAD